MGLLTPGPTHETMGNMFKRVSILIVPVLVLFLAACRPPESPEAAPPFAQLRDQWATDLAAHNLEPSVAHYAQDATFINPDGTHAQGSDQIRDLFASVFGVFDARIQFASRQTSESGDLAYDSGSWTETITERANHDVHQTSGDYLTVYRHTPDGKWLIAQQVWTEAATPK